MTTELNLTGRQLVLQCTGAQGIVSEQCVQTLWSGYGKIVRVTLDHAQQESAGLAKTVIVKQIKVPAESRHPRGWNSTTSMQRKITSYQVETNWYKHYANECRKVCAMPEFIALTHKENQTWLLMEDLDPVYPLRHERLSPETCIACLKWLAQFHGYHLQSNATDLWPVGCYWHLQTRLDEFNAMPDGPLKNAANALDERLRQCHWQTLVHGDAKVANACFSKHGSNVAFVDYQYTGRGCGIRDVVYFLGSCLSEHQCERHANRLLDTYFHALKKCIPAPLGAKVEREWRNLYSIAWADFHRFLAGWMPDHHKINSYSLAMTQKALKEL